jgi:hypothetical protein
MLKSRDSTSLSLYQERVVADRVPLATIGSILIVIGLVTWNPFLIIGGILWGVRLTRVAQRYL